MLNVYTPAQAREYVRHRSPKYAGLGPLACAGGQLSALAQGRTTAGATVTPEWQLVERITLGASATTQDFASTLDGNADLGYRIVASIVNAASAYTIYSLRVNGATIGSDRRYIFASGTTITTAATGAGTAMMGLQASSGTATQGLFYVQLRFARTGYQRIWRYSGSRGNNNTDWQEDTTGTLRMTTPATSTNITSLGVVADQTNGLGAGTILTLYKKGG